MQKCGSDTDLYAPVQLHLLWWGGTGETWALKVVQGPNDLHNMQPWKSWVNQQNLDVSMVNLSELQFFFSFHFL